jgi:hypothetical protein
MQFATVTVTEEAQKIFLAKNATAAVSDNAETGGSQTPILAESSNKKRDIDQASLESPDSTSALKKAKIAN